MNFRKAMSILLALCIALPLLPPQAQAVQNADTCMDISIEGTNSLGALLSAEIAASMTAEEAAASDYQAGYAISEMTISGSTATVTYSALEEATLVVAVYTEDGLQLLASGKASVSAEETTATVTIEGDMPEYFYAAAYLMDSRDFSPLCASYETPMYTQEMQELLASTIHDYEADRVYNLDDDETNNFVVFDEDAVVIREQAGVNTVASANDDTMVYVIENADETITSLQPGDVLAYPYGEGQILIVKVSSVTTDGTTATITGAELTMQEAFQAVKIEARTGDFEVEEGPSANSITYLGDAPQPQSYDPSLDRVRSVNFDINLGGDGKNAAVTGTLTFSITTNVDCYISETYTKLEFKLDVTQKYAITATGKFQIDGGVEFCDLAIKPLPGVTVAMTPRLLLEFSGAVALEYSFTASIGFRLENDGTSWKFHPICEQPGKQLDLKLEGTVFLGVGLTPSLKILEGLLAEGKIEGKLGVELKGTRSFIHIEENPSSLHDCTNCIDGDVSLVYSVVPSIQLLGSDRLTLKVEWSNVKVKYLDFYWSRDRDEFHLGTCPYISYRVTICVFDENFQPVPDISVHLTNGTVHSADKHGTAVVYLPNGSYTASTLSNDITASTDFTVAGQSRKVLLAAFLQDPEPGIVGSVDSETVTDYGAVVDFGSCSDTLTWFLKTDGTLILAGTGEMPRFSTSNQPWYSHKDSITGLQVLDGITSIGGCAFYRHTNLASISLSPTVEEIGWDAFYGCSSLTDVFIPASVTKIQSNAFGNCSSLQQFRVDEQNTHYSSDDYGVLFDKDKTALIQAPATITGSYGVPEGVVTIFNYAFQDCANLTDIVIPDSVTGIGTYAFSGCASLNSAILSSNIAEIPTAAFSGCEALSKISIPGNVTSIGNRAFSGCKSLTELVLPEGLTTIGNYAFSMCDRLTNINFPGSLVSIGDNAFYYCSALSSILLPEGLVSIGSWAFYDCDAIQDFYLPSTLTSIGPNAFAGIDGITSVSIPESLTVIESGTFSFCYYLSSLTIANGVTTIGDTAFKWDLKLPSVTIPESVTYIGTDAFYNCKALKKITFLGDAPTIDGTTTFFDVTATVYYPAGNTTWTADVMQNYGGKLTWVPYTLDGSGNMITGDTVTEAPEAEITELPEPLLPASLTDDLIIEEPPAEGVSPDAVYGGEYSTEVLDMYTLKTASFSGLVPGGDYVMLAMVRIDAEDILAADNLLGILQGTAAEDGTLVFQYVQRVDTDISYVIACGPSGKNLSDAEITFPEMTAGGEPQVVNPTVIYDGEVLTEGVDYEITGTVDFTEAGEYTCYITGIHNYTGTVTCTYTVQDVVRGDVNGDGEIDIFDANLVVAYYNETIELTETQLLAADVNGDGEIDIFDANLIVAYYNETIDTFPAK